MTGTAHKKPRRHAAGDTRNPLLMELYADATGCTVIEPKAGGGCGTARFPAEAGGDEVS